MWTQRTEIWTQGMRGGEGGMDGKSCITICKIAVSIAVRLRELEPGLCDNLDGRDAVGGGREV